jgi:hypothetical protein
MNFKIRSYQRFAVQCPIFYLCQEFIAQGSIWNLSRKGWRVDGEHDVTVGMVLALCIFLPGHQVPITVERATVRWSRGQEFGLETIYMRPDQHTRFRHFVRSLVEQQNQLQAPTAEPSHQADL